LFSRSRLGVISTLIEAEKTPLIEGRLVFFNYSPN